MALTSDDLVVGRTYRAKRPQKADGGLVNDRLIKWRNAGYVQYDGPAVRQGARYPTVSVADFLRWADRDVTDELPKGEREPWADYRRARAAK